ncbi:MAG: hypothetical protein HUU21_11780 [Polyangiaceae bacterium]|nr:hypothetical protein [Polyangiaceae bacterium]
MNKTIGLIAAAIMVSTISCSQGPGDGGPGANPAVFDGYLDPQGVGFQGESLNGISTQGISTQGISTQGDELKGFVFASFVNTNGPISNVTLQGTVFHGTDGLATPISGAGFIDAELNAVRGDDTLTPMKIVDVQTSESDSEITLYELAWHDGTSWVNPCGEENGLPIMAIPFAGRWKYASGTPDGGDYINDPNLFTFSCTTGTIAKCALRGYKPWKTIEECNGQSNCQTLSLQPFHQACTRMMRADYCGNGTPHTVTGTLINMYDNFDIQLDESTTMALEAEWTPDGAKCVKHLRWTTGGQSVIDDAQDDIDQNCPGIDDPAAQAICGTSLSTYTTTWGYSVPLNERALLRNESEPPPN